jgi:hypothetical protein
MDLGVQIQVDPSGTLEVHVGTAFSLRYKLNVVKTNQPH